MTTDPTRDLVGAALGFVLGCLGLAIAGFFFGGQHLRGAVVGYGARLGLILGVGSVAVAYRSLSSEPVAWELACPLGTGAFLFAVGILGAAWVFARSSGAEDEAPPPPSKPEYVTFTREDR